jgi:cell division transport system ATP-binding protein
MATHNKEIVDVLQKRVIAINDGQVTRDDASGGYHALAVPKEPDAN